MYPVTEFDDVEQVDEHIGRLGLMLSEENFRQIESEFDFGYSHSTLTGTRFTGKAAERRGMPKRQV